MTAIRDFTIKWLPWLMALAVFGGIYYHEYLASQRTLEVDKKVRVNIEHAEQNEALARRSEEMVRENWVQLRALAEWATRSEDLDRQKAELIRETWALLRSVSEKLDEANRKK